MTKKGQAVFIGVIITAVLAVILVANLLIPTVHTTTTPTSFSETYARTNASLNQTKTLANHPIHSITSIGNGTTTLPAANYTVNYAGGTVTFLQTSAPVATYTIAYTYEQNSFISGDPAAVTLMGIVVIVAILGVVYWILAAFGLI